MKELLHKSTLSTEGDAASSLHPLFYVLLST